MHYSFVRIFASVFLFCLSALTVKADSYQFSVVASTNNHYWVSANDYGDYVTSSYGSATPGGSPCGTANVCYALYQASSKTTTYSAVQPVLQVAPNPAAGSGCTFDMSSAPGTQSVCSNGHEYVYGFYNNLLGLFAVNGNQLNRIYNSALAGTPLVTANGNIFFYDGLSENLIAGIDLTNAPAAVPFAVTPEPLPGMLLGTGTLLVLGLAKKRNGRSTAHASATAG